MTSHTDRIVVLVDMDCFYCQVEEKLNSALAGKPIAVVQYNAWKGGGLIAVNYPARDKGVTRHMRGDEAKEKCPDIELVRVPTVRGKADLTKYREAGKRVAEVLQTYTALLQRASIDEAYLDITEAVNNRIASLNREVTSGDLERTYIVGCETIDFITNVYNSELHNDNNLRLLVGGMIVEEIRAAVYDKTGYRCSAGIAHNKILAKLVCGMNKPNKQTILPDDGVAELYKTLPIKKIKSLGGKFGNTLSEDLNIKFMSELAQFSVKELTKRYDDKTAIWLYNIAKGIDNEPVETRLISKSIGCCKRFPGKTALITIEDVTHWLSELSEEISERLEQDLEENNRRAKQIILSFAQEINRKDLHSSRTQPLPSYDAKKIAEDSIENLKRYTQKPDGSFAIKFLGLSAGKFEENKKVNQISSFFKQIDKNDIKHEETKHKTNETTVIDDSQRVEKKKSGLMNYFNTVDNNGNNFPNSKEKNEKSNKKKSNIMNFFHINNSTNVETNIISKGENKLDSLLLEINKNIELGNLHESTNEVSNVSTKQIISDNNLKKDTQNNSKESLLTNKNNLSDLNLSDIENDVEIESNEIPEILINKSTFCEEDNFSDSTIEIDYTERLKNKIEFHRDEFQTMNDSINLENKTEISQNNFYFQSNSNSLTINETSCDLNISGQISPVLEQGKDNTKSFFMRYIKKFESRNIEKKSDDENSRQSLLHNNFSSIVCQSKNVELKNSTDENIRQSSLQNDIKISSVVYEPVAGCSKTNQENLAEIHSDSSNYSISDNKLEDHTDGSQLMNVDDNINSMIEIENNKENIQEIEDVCPECNERIPKSMYISHLDHHMALKLMQEERQLFKEELEIEKHKRLELEKQKQNKSPMKPTKNIKPAKQVKRKLSQPDTNKIASFLIQKPDTNSSQSESCPECGKQVEISDLSSHLDFHAAKKLHLELNPVKFSNKTPIVINKKKDFKSISSTGKKKDIKNVQNLSNFFKPLG